MSQKRTEALQQLRLDPNAAAVHLDDLLGDGEPAARAALRLGKEPLTWWNCSKIRCC